MSTRLIQMSDEQLGIIKTALVYTTPGMYTPEQNYEIGMLVGMINDVFEMPDSDPKLLHGFVL
jgi:hypothetical protein